ncbi:MAG: hypothetical protein MUE44_32035 [Oscillatoriaceae cyanobacterium Prado104]|jgi:hypothetical protein|nr:hypothetical protein [Oscillatoriaceae cyanobacterium Prado104]
MNERQEAYLNLIERVLTCPHGQEPEILKASSDLVDAGFVAMLIKISASMASEGDEYTAKFLEKLACLLAKSVKVPPEAITTEYSSVRGYKKVRSPHNL